MQQVLTFPEPMAGLAVRRQGSGKESRFTDAEYWAFCAANRDLHIERTADGEIMVAPPAGGESDYRNIKVSSYLDQWAEREATGKAFGPSVQYFLPDGSGLSPDASWVSNASLDRLTKAQRKKFLRLVPEFVVEILSPTDNLKQARAKMEQWIANGVELGWLMDADAETIYVYRPGKPCKIRRHLKEIAGEAAVAGFVLKLEAIWRGL